MRRLSLLFAAIALVATPLVMAGPAQADHAVDVGVDVSGKAVSCVWGERANPTGLSLHTSKVELRLDSAGLLVGYTCIFQDVPSFVAAEDQCPESDSCGGWVDWVMPKSATVFPEQFCLVPYNVMSEYVDFPGTAKITPGGTAVVHCGY